MPPDGYKPKKWGTWGDWFDTLDPVATEPEPAVETVTVIVVASDGQIHGYKGPESGIKKWLASLRRKGVKVGVGDLPQ